MATKVCVICGNEFESNQPKAKYCSEKCRKVGNSKMADEWYWNHKIQSSKGNKKICPICGKEVLRSRAKYCSELCAYKAKFEKTESTKKKPPKRRILSLCWDCQNACCGCSWSRSFEPVEGWEARPSGDSFFVINCPQFIPDEER